MSDYGTPKPQSILHQIGRLGSKLTKPLTTKNKRKKVRKKLDGGDGVYDENGIFHEVDASGHEDFSSVNSHDDYEDTLFDEESLPQIAEEKQSDQDSQEGKAMKNVVPASDHHSQSSSNQDRRRRNSHRIDSSGVVF
ncbi:MAG: hypothetical protein SGBAC_006595 [Bacillariaceae sp.]